MPLPTHRNPLAVFIVAALILGVVGALVVITTLRFIEDSRWVAHTTAALSQVEDIAALEASAIAAQRGYLLTGDEERRTAFWEARARMPEELRELDALVQYRPARKKLAVLEPILLERMTLASRAVGVYEQQGLAAAQAHIKANGSQKLDRQIAALIKDTRALEWNLLQMRRQKSERSANWLLIVTVFGISLSLLMLVGVYRVLASENAERRKSEVRLRHLSGSMTGLSKYAAMLQSCEDITELLTITRHAMVLLTPSVAGTVYLIRASRNHAEAAMQWGEHAAPSGDLLKPSDCWAVRRNQPFCCDDVHASVACSHVGMPPEGASAATACVPLSAHGELMGWLYLSTAEPGPIADFELASQAAEQFSLALANLRLQEALRHQSIRDSLTGLFNRRYLEESLAREISRCQRRNLPLVVLMFDLDSFKTFNDHHGHTGGDALLSAFGRLLQANSRPEDIPCRFGGEEFVLILPEAARDIGLQRGRTILSATAQLVVQHRGVALEKVTTSAGMSMLPDHGSTTSALIEAADKALYQAKSEGRNRVCVAPGAQDPASTIGQPARQP